MSIKKMLKNEENVLRYGGKTFYVSRDEKAIRTIFGKMADDVIWAVEVLYDYRMDHTPIPRHPFYVHLISEGGSALQFAKTHGISALQEEKKIWIATHPSETNSYNQALRAQWEAVRAAEQKLIRAAAWAKLHVNVSAGYKVEEVVFKKFGHYVFSISAW